MSECSNCDVLRSQKRELNTEIGRLSAENIRLSGCANEGNCFCRGYKRVVLGPAPETTGMSGWTIIKDNCGLLIENPKTGQRMHIWYGGLSDHVAEIEQLKEELAKANETVANLTSFAGKIAESLGHKIVPNKVVEQGKCSTSETNLLKVELAKANDLIQEIDKTLRVPAAEYVPAIGYVFTLIDKAKKS